MVVCAAGFAMGCTTKIPDGTYALAMTGDSCQPMNTTSVTFENDTVVGDSAAVIDGSNVTFDAMYSYRNSDSGDFTDWHEHFELTVGATTLTGTLTASYDGMFYTHTWSCMPTLAVTGTRD